jgi:Trypsin-like serine proteases, typically periplasmic, contain C-terminal PDZ domain
LDQEHIVGQIATTQEECHVDLEKRHSERAFAKVGVVMPGSPAQEAGLKTDDLIMKFGTVDFSNNRNLQALSEIVRNAHSDGNYIVVVVSRMIMMDANIHEGGKLLQFKLRPKEWSGKGLVGCAFEPVI